MIITQDELRGLDTGELSGIICRMDIRTKSLVVLLVILTVLFLSACTPAAKIKRELDLQQAALSNALKLCVKFGHKEGTPQFTRCAEQRYDEFILTNK
jgi:hypothetical protein